MSLPGEDYASNAVVMVMMSTFYNNDHWASNLQQGVFLTDELLWVYCVYFYVPVCTSTLFLHLFIHFDHLLIYS